MSYSLIIDSDRCKGCELCVEFCPRHVLAMAKTLNTSGFHFPQTLPDGECTGCRQCAIICPEAAIEIEKTEGARQPAAAGRPGAAARLKEDARFKKHIEQLAALGRRQGHLTRHDIRERVGRLPDAAVDLEDFILLFREMGIEVREHTGAPGGNRK